MASRTNSVTSLVASTHFAAPAFGLRDRASVLVAALHSKFADLGFQVADLQLRNESPKPVDWWIVCPLLAQRAQLALGIHHAQITLWNVEGGEEDLVIELWTQLEEVVSRELAPVEADRRELAFHGHFPVSDERFNPPPGSGDDRSLGEVVFSGRLLHFRSESGVPSRVILDRSTELPNALYLWVNSGWKASSSTIAEAVAAFSTLLSKAMTWAEVNVDDR